MKKHMITFCIMAVAGCGHNEAGDKRIIQLTAAEPIVASVNGTLVPQSLLEAIAIQHNWHLDQPAQRGQALRTLTDLILVSQEAQRADYFADPRFQANMEAARLKSVADITIAEFEKHTTIADATLRSEYDTQTAHTARTTYDYIQLVFATEDEAKKAQAEFATGKPFQQAYNAWRGRATQARVFTHVSRDQVPDDLLNVISRMKDGDTTRVPLKTQSGWQIVHLQMVNQYAPPEFDQVKEGIRRNLQVKINREHLDKLRENAKIEYSTNSPLPVGQRVTTHDIANPRTP